MADGLEPISTPTPNPSPNKEGGALSRPGARIPLSSCTLGKQGLGAYRQLIVAITLPFPHFGGRGRGMGA